MSTFGDFIKSNNASSFIMKGKSCSIWATRECVLFINSTGKKFAYPLSDLYQCLRVIWESGDKLDRLLREWKPEEGKKTYSENHWDYIEVKFRDAFEDIFDGMGPNTVSATVGSQTPCSVRCLELFAYYLLKRTPANFGNCPDVLRYEELNCLFEGTNLKPVFSRWLQAKNLSSSTIEKYVIALEGVLSRCSDQKLFSITFPRRFEELTSAIVAHPDFIERNENGNGMYNAALNNYREFLIERHEGLPVKNLLGSFRQALSGIGFANFG
jgi:hypothetical protein